MTSKTKIKFSTLLLIPVALLIAVDIIILQGGFFVEKISVLPRRVKPAALEKNPQENGGDLGNVGVKNFSVKTKSPDGRFRRVEPIEVSCTVENTSAKVVKNFRSVLRTPEKDLSQIQTKTFKPGEKFELKGDFTPENSGVLIVACRSDSEKIIEESNENDNREIAVLYIQ